MGRYVYGEEEENGDLYCYCCGERLKDGDVCRACYESGRDNAYREGYNEGYKKGLEEGKRQGKSDVLSEIEYDYSLPSDIKRRIILRHG